MNKIIAVYADGGVVDRNPSQLGGTWAWCHVDAHGWRVDVNSGVLTPFADGGPGPTIGNNQAEFYALLLGLEALPSGWFGDVCSDSNNTLGRFFKGWATNGIPPRWVSRMLLTLSRLDLTRVRPVLLQGHPSGAELLAGVGKTGRPVSAHNVFCDRECARAGQAFLAPR